MNKSKSESKSAERENDDPFPIFEALVFADSHKAYKEAAINLKAFIRSNRPNPAYITHHLKTHIQK